MAVFCRFLTKDAVEQSRKPVERHISPDTSTVFWGGEIMGNIVIRQQSWFSRMGNAFKGILIGLVLVLAGVALLWWNEGRAVLTAQGLTEGAGLVISVAADHLDPANEGRLAHTSGRALTGGSLTDPDFPYMTVKALALQRSVEMFQWQEESHTRDIKELGGGTRQETTYTYKKIWSASPIDSSRFYEQSGHFNPSAMPYAAMRLTAPDATLGAFRLPPAMLTLSTLEALGAPEDAPVSGQQKVARGQIYIGPNPDVPGIGDVRIIHTYAPEQDISVVARQQGDSFAPFPVQGGQRSIQMLKAGLYDAPSMFSAAQSENAMLTWALRGLGLVGLFVGFFMILRPLAILGDVVPLLGSLVGVGVGLIAFALAAAGGLLVMGVAWCYYSPLLGIALLVGAGSALLGLKMLVRKSRAAAALEQAPVEAPAQG